LAEDQASLTGADMDNELTAVFQKVDDVYIAFVEELPGANTQGATLEEARANLEEAVRLVLDANPELEEGDDQRQCDLSDSASGIWS
jgi:predicted RNase H-like HicB family nuclease